LLGAHRKPDHQPDLLDAKMLRDETMLTNDVVVDRDVGKDGAVERRRGIAG
jgi:hypothetical protein